MIKKVAILNDVIVNVYHNDEQLTSEAIDGATIEEREMVYSAEKGWQLADARLTPSQEDILTAKIQMETINLLIELGVI